MTHSIGTALEQHAHSLRELARALVGPCDADDVVQATAAEALANPHPVREPVAFLRHLLRVQAHRLHRGDARRRHREHAHALGRDDAVPPAEHAVEQRQAVAQLHAALMTVPQPHLGALLLRYFEDLSPPAIAERLAVPLPTIKSRLARGLELLRAELDRRGPRDQWQQRLSTALALPPAALVRAGAATPFVAIVIMKLVAAVLFVGIAAGVWLVWPHADVVPPATGAVAANDLPAARAAEATVPPVPVPDVSRSIVASEGATTARVTGRVTSSDGSALAGATVVVLPPFVFDAAPTASAVTDASGAFACAVPPGEHFVYIAALRHAAVYSDKREFAAASTTDLGTIAMRAGVVVRGRVIDRDGAAVVGTRVATGSNNLRVDLPRGWWLGGRPVLTDHDGRFELAPLPPFDYSVRVPEEQLLEPLLVRLEPGQPDVDVVVRVESASRQPTIRGRVVDEGGRGVAAANVTATERVELDDHRFVATTASDGTFTIRRLVSGAPKAVPVTATAKSCDVTSIDAIEWGRNEVEIVLRPLAALTVRVVDASGAPVQRFTVRVGPVKEHAPGIDWHIGPFVTHEADGATNGEHTIPDLGRGFVDVHVTPAAAQLAASNVRRIQITGGRQHETFTLQARVHRVVWLRVPDGTAVAGAKIELSLPCLGTVDLRTYVVAIDRWTLTHVPGKALRIQVGTTDANGDLLLDGPAATPLALRVLGPGCLPVVLPIERLDGDGPLVVECRRGGTLRVIAQPADVLAALAALRNVERDDPRPNAFVVRDLARARERVPSDRDDVRSFDENGVATVAGVPDGTWLPHVAFARDELLLPAVAIADGATSDVVLDLAPFRPVTIRGRVVADMPIAGRNVNIERFAGAGEQFAGRWITAGGSAIRLDDAGAFELRALPGKFRLLLMHDRGDGDVAELRAEPASIDVAPGATCEQTFTVATGSVALRFVDAQLRPVAGVAGGRLLRADGYHLVYLPPSDAAGCIRFDVVEAGRIRLVVLPQRLGAAKAAIPALCAEHPDEPDIVTRTELDLGSITVARGAPIEQTFVLPDAWFR